MAAPKQQKPRRQNIEMKIEFRISPDCVLATLPCPECESCGNYTVIGSCSRNAYEEDEEFQKDFQNAFVGLVRRITEQKIADMGGKVKSFKVVDLGRENP